MDRILKGKRALKGKIRVPGDKSISHRAVILGSIANGTSNIGGVSDSNDVVSSIKAMKKIGVDINQKNNITTINGSGLSGFINIGKKNPVEIDCGNSGTTARLLIGLLSGAGIKSRITGDASLLKRPMDRVVYPLSKAGENITSNNGYLPVNINGGGLVPFEYSIPVASAQVKSSLILAALFIQGVSVIIEPVETRDHTERMLLLMDADIKIKRTLRGKNMLITGRKELTPIDFEVPGDISSACYFIASALITPSSDVVIENVLLNRTRAHILDVFKRMGGIIDIELTSDFPEPVGNIRVKSSKLQGISVGGFEIPLIIDEIPVLAALGFFAEGDTVVRGASELRVKESDRIKSVVHMIKSFGGKIDELDNGFIVHGKNKPNEAEIESFCDHRIAMAASVIAQNSRSETKIKNAECVDVSFPHFFDLMDKFSG